MNPPGAANSRNSRLHNFLIQQADLAQQGEPCIQALAAIFFCAHLGQAAMSDTVKLHRG